MKTDRIKATEDETLRTFQEELPSVYFSDKSEQEFRAYAARAEHTYRSLFKFPPRMFAGADLIDFGAGTGENTVAMALWGANCTLVELNDQALAIARHVFATYAPAGDHAFVQSSIFDFESPRQYDVVQSRGVLAHTADKAGAFRRIASFVKPGGFLIYGDPNKAGGFQNMLQRFAVYHYAESWNEMVRVCELLFKEDIDRSERFMPRSRRSIIFDRWVIQSQDDPSVDEVVGWLGECGFELYSSYPPFTMPLIGDTVNHQPRFDSWAAHGAAALAETVWLLQNNGDVENAEALNGAHCRYADDLAALTEFMANWNSHSRMDIIRFNQLAAAASSSVTGLCKLEQIKLRFSAMMREATEFVGMVGTNASLDEVRSFVVACKHLFKGACGVRNVDFIAYKR